MAEAGFRPHPRTQLDDNFASPIRFSLMAALGDGMEFDFPALRDILQCGDSPLSKAIAHLPPAQTGRARRGGGGGRTPPGVRATTAGRDAFAAHLQALRQIVALGGGQEL